MKEGDDEKKNSGRNHITFAAHLLVGYSRRGDSVNSQGNFINFKPCFASGFVANLDFSRDKCNLDL